MKKQNGITIISLVVTIIVLIILAGVSINLVLGENGIVTKAKEAKKAQTIAETKEKIGTEILAAQIEATERNEELEHSQISDIISNYGNLQEDGDTIILKENLYEISLKEIYSGTITSTGSYSELKAQNALLKQQLEDASKSESESNRELVELKTTLSQITATESQILKDYTAYKDGKLITGTMTDNGAINITIDSGKSYTIPAGYHNGNGTVTANANASTRDWQMSIQLVLESALYSSEYNKNITNFCTKTANFTLKCINGNVSIISSDYNYSNPSLTTRDQWNVYVRIQSFVITSFQYL